MAAGAARGCRRRTRRWRSDRAGPARRSCRAPPRRRAARRRSAARCGGPWTAPPAGTAARLRRSAPDGARAITSSALLPPVAQPVERAITASSSPLSVLPATSTGRFGDMRKKRSTRSRPRPGVGTTSSASNFRLPVTVMRAGSAPSCDQPPRRFVALHAEPIDVGQHAPEERPDQPVARERSVRDAAVHEHRLDAAAAALAQQVRPDLGLDHHEQPRLDEVQRAAHA